MKLSKIRQQEDQAPIKHCRSAQRFVQQSMDQILYKISRELCEIATTLNIIFLAFYTIFCIRNIIGISDTGKYEAS